MASGDARRGLLCLLVWIGMLGGGATSASAHATLLRSTPAAKASVASAPSQVVLAFSEPVEILRPLDVSVVDEQGNPVTAGIARTNPRDASMLTIPLKAGLHPASYTVRYRVISADSHGVEDALAFATAGAAVRLPVLSSAGGPSETSPWTVAARFVEVSALGLLLALLAFRWLVWTPAVRSSSFRSPDHRAAAQAEGTRLFWLSFWRIGALALLAEAYMLIVKTAVIEGTSVWASLVDPASAYRLFAYSRYGALFGWRVVLVLALLAVGYFTWLGETADDAIAPEQRWTPSAAAMAALSVGTLELVSYQGHASQAVLAPASVIVDSVHLGAVAIWLGGLPCLAAALIRAPKVLGDDGRALAAAVLRRFSRLALAAVGIVALTGLARAVAQLSAPSQLWETAYGRSLIYKTVLLWPIAFLAFYNRRVLVALARKRRPTLATLDLLRRNLAVELAIGAAILVVAALLAGQVPGRV